MDYTESRYHAIVRSMRIAEMLLPTEPQSDYTAICHECGAELAHWCDVQYTYRSSGRILGCSCCIDAHERETEPHYICDCTHFDPQTTETVYTLHNTDYVIGCSECVNKYTEVFLA